jgi:hydrogenase nickel incorporation protein HypA/HybF
MHELALTEKMLRLILTEAENHQAEKITKINICLGELSGIIEDCVAYYFQLLARDTIAAGAELEFSLSTTRLFCPNCELEFEKTSRDFNCRVCGGLSRLTGSGREWFIESIEVE